MNAIDREKCIGSDTERGTNLQYAFYKYAEKYAPTTLVCDLGDYCPWQCPHCSRVAGPRGNRANLDTVLHGIRGFREFVGNETPLLTIQFSGGEPLHASMRENLLYPSIRAAQSHGFRVEILTNGQFALDSNEGAHVMRELNTLSGNRSEKSKNITLMPSTDPKHPAQSPAAVAACIDTWLQYGPDIHCELSIGNLPDGSHLQTFHTALCERIPDCNSPMHSEKDGVKYLFPLKKISIGDPSSMDCIYDGITRLNVLTNEDVIALKNQATTAADLLYFLKENHNIILQQDPNTSLTTLQSCRKLSVTRYPIRPIGRFANQLQNLDENSPAAQIGQQFKTDETEQFVQMMNSLYGSASYLILGADKNYYLSMEHMRIGKYPLARNDGENSVSHAIRYVKNHPQFAALLWGNIATIRMFSLQDDTQQRIRKLLTMGLSYEAAYAVLEANPASLQRYMDTSY